MPETSATITFGGFPVYLPEVLAAACRAAGEPTDWVGKANTWRNPRGQQAGRGWILMLGVHLDQLALDVSTHTLLFDETGDRTTRITCANLTIVRADAILPGPTPTPETMYLVEVTDCRGYGQQTTSITSRGYNLRALPREHDNATDQQTLVDASRSAHATLYTWAEVLSGLWGLVNTNGLFGAWSAVDVSGASYPTDRPENIDFEGLSTWEVFNHVLEHIGMVLIRKRAGTFAIVPVGQGDASVITTVTSLASRLLGVKHSRFSASLALPANVIVRFPYVTRCNASTTTSNAWISYPYFRVLKTTAATFPYAATVAGTYVTVYDTLTVKHDLAGETASGSFAGDTAVNAAVLETRAGEIASAWLRMRYNQVNTTFTHHTYSGLVDIEPSATVSAVVYYDRGQGMKTDIIFHPYQLDPNADYVVSRPADALSGLDRWEVLDQGPGWGVFEGLATAGFTDADATISVDNIRPIDGGPSCLDDPTSTSETATVYNITGFAGDNNNIVYFRWNHYTQKLVLYDTACPA